MLISGDRFNLILQYIQLYMYLYSILDNPNRTSTADSQFVIPKIRCSHMLKHGSVIKYPNVFLLFQILQLVLVVTFLLQVSGQFLSINYGYFGRCLLSILLLYNKGQIGMVELWNHSLQKQNWFSFMITDPQNWQLGGSKTITIILNMSIEEI